MNTDKHRYFRSLNLAITVFYLGSFSLFGQTAEIKSLPLTVTSAIKFADSGELDSKLMARKMPYLVVTPGKYSANNADRFPVIYLLHGGAGSHKNWVENTKLVQYAANSGFIVVTPEGNNGWYTDSVSVPNDKYETYIVKELIPEIDAKFRTIANRENRIVAGLSMGGYGSVKFGLKYPDLFSLAGSFSGAVAAAAFTEKNAAGAGRRIDMIMGPEGSTGRTSNDLFKLVRELTPERLKALPFIYQSCGNEDFLIQSNRDFMALLVEKKVPHEYRQHPGVHDWVFWDDQIREFLQVADRRLKK
jgi:S-formylglutathione hydrolase FrmB